MEVMDMAETIKLKFKNNIWNINGPGVKETGPNYHRMLDKAMIYTREKKGTLEIYNPDGSFKTKYDFFMK